MKKIFKFVITMSLSLILTTASLACNLGEHKHSFGDDNTCHDRVCSTCGQTVSATTRHTFADSFTCHDRTCLECGDKVKATVSHLLPDHFDCQTTNCLLCGDSVLGSVEHSFGKYQVFAEQDCIQDGVKGRICSVCGEEDLIITQAWGHNFDENGKCRNLGCDVTLDEFNNLHAFSDDYSCHDRVCHLCEENVKATTSHVYLNDASCVDKTCFLCGATVKATASHSPNSYTCKTSNCSTCGEYIASTTSHVLDGAGKCACGFETDLENMTFKETTGGYELVSYTGSKSNVIIPNTYNGSSVVKIGARAFYGNVTLLGVSIPKTVKAIDYRAFYACENLMEVNFEQYCSLYELGDEIFGDCSSLKSIFVPMLVKEIPFGTFSNCVKLEYAKLPYAVEVIGSYAFRNCQSLITIEFPNTVKELGTGAFSNCKVLKAVELGDNVNLKAIPDRTFEDCYGLSKLVLPSNLVYLGNAFNNCKSLLDVTIPNGLAQVNAKVFSGCDKILHVRNYSNLEIKFDNYQCEIVTDSKKPFNKTIIYNEDGVVLFDNGREIAIVSYLANQKQLDLSSYDDVSSIYQYAFYGSSIEQVIIPASVVKIGNYAFSNCSALSSVSFAEGSLAKTLGTDVFSGCEYLTTLEIPAHVEEIGNFTFFGCSRLVQVRNLSSIQDLKLNNLEIQIVNDAQSQFTSSIIMEDDSMILSVGQKKYLMAYFGKEVNVDLSQLDVTDIYPNCFANNDKMETIILPTNLKGIGEKAFASCTALKQIDIPTSVSSIASFAFVDCINLKQVEFASNINLAKIENGVFENCSSLEQITIPASVTDITDRAFYGCENMVTLNFATGSKLQTIHGNAFNGCLAITELNLPSTIEVIEEYAFYGCKGIKSFDFGENSSIEYIGDYAFFECIAIEELDFGTDYNLKVIGEYAFSSSSKATVLVLPGQIDNIFDHAFSGCNGVKELYFGGSVEKWEILHDNDLTNGEFYMDHRAVIEATKPRYMYSETAPTRDGNYWHYVNGQRVIWENN